ncbi:hypothetical protein G4G27_00180 [Sphingomonas sp. So64.6b]|uniref:hypothetical protein n=1 Tax=Sphingomonas sp. So64.6b TaxID=2997354 RepID=UPI0016043D0E|nr:hypothetical protein [Sphingomonas sp. So64.6b]QNA82603.1 hypothetical protein G4G27_00180 [Sphingomonas sp. So64.6b]
MAGDAAQDMKTRIRTDLRAAMKEGRISEANLTRVLIAAIDNAEAPPLQAGETLVDQGQFRNGSAEVEHLLLNPTQMRAVLMAEIQERERAAEEMTRLERPDRADALRAEVLLARRYIE